MDPIPLDLIPAPWLAAAHQWAPYMLAALVLTTALSRALLPVARRVEVWARETPATWDDGLAGKAVIAIEWIAAASAGVLAWVPRLAMRPPQPPPEVPR